MMKSVAIVLIGLTLVVWGWAGGFCAGRASGEEELREQALTSGAGHYELVSPEQTDVVWVWTPKIGEEVVDELR